MLNPADMVNPNVDELSMMTYLSQFLTAKLKPGAPLKPTGNPLLVKVFGPGIQKEGVNMTMPSALFTVDTEGAGPGKVGIHCTGPSGPIKVDIVPSGKNTYSCSYVPSVQGIYTMEIYFSRRAVPGSPFKIQVSAGMAVLSPTRRGTLTKLTAATTATPDFKLSGPGLNGELLLVNQTLKYLVEARGTGPGKIACTVHVLGQQIQCTPIVVEVKDGTFSIECTPTVAGSHMMVVTFNDKPIPKSPICLKVIDVSKVNVYGTGLSGGIATKWAEFTIDSSTAGEGKSEVSISGPTTVQPTLQSGSDGVTKVKFLPAVPGKYTITILFGNQTVPGSPFFATFSKPETGKVYVISGPGLKQDGIVVNATAQFSFDSKSAASEKFTVMIVGPVTGAAAEKHTQSPHAIPTVIKNTNGTYNISYKPQLVGLYRVHLYLNGQELQESPIPINVTDPTKVNVTGPGMQEMTDGKPGPVIPITEVLQWTLNCCNAGLGPLQATLQRDEEQAIDLQITAVGNGFHTIKSKPNRVGKYRLCLKFAGNAVPFSPTFVLTSKEMPCDVTKVTVYGTGVGDDGAQTGSSLSIFIDTRSAGLPGHITATLTKPHGEISGLHFKPDKKEGIYFGEYISYETGCHKLSICIDDKPIPKSPFTIPLCKPTAVKLSGSGLDGAMPKIPNTINILTDEAGPGKVAVEFEGPSNADKVEYTLKQISEHNYQLKYNPSVTGNYYITITYGGLPVQKKLKVLCKSMESYVVEDIDGVEGNKEHIGTSKTNQTKYINVGEKTEIQLAKIPGNKHEVSIDMKGPHDCKIITKESSNDTHSITLVPKTIGTYQLCAMQGRTKLNGSPFIIKVVNRSGIKLNGPGITGSVQIEQTKHYPYTEQLHWIVDYTSTGFEASDIIATMNGELGYSQKLAVTEKDASHASITFAPNRCGPYKLQVLAGGQEVPHSPVNISLQDVNRVTASGPGLVRGCVGKPVTVTFDTTQAGEGSLSLQIQGPANVTPACTSEEPGTFVVKFEPTKAGAYTLKAMYGDKDIPGSPFSIPIIDPAEVAVSGTAVTGKGLGVGKKAEVFVDTTQAGNAPVKATVTTPSGKDIPLSLVPTETDGVLHGEYVPDEPGKHKFHVNFNEEPIPQSPYDVLVPSQEECSVIEQEDLQSAPSGFHDLPQLVIDTPVGEPSAVEAWVDAPNQKQLQCSVTNQGNKCKVCFFPLTTGMHLVHVTRNKLPVQGSPFPVNVTAQQVLNIEGPEVTQLAVGQPVKLEVSEGVEGKGELEVNVEGPADCRVETQQNPDSTYTIELTPTLAGTYLVHLTHGNRLVRGSPFVVKVFNPLEVKLSGPGVVDSEEDNAQPKPLPLDQQLEWTVDFTSAGLVASDLSATVYGLEGYSQKLAVTDKDAYHASITFAPNRCGPYKLQVLAGGQEVPHSPVNISLQDVNRVTASGPGLVGGCVGKPVTVTFDTTQAGEGSLSLQIQGPTNVTPACTSEEPGTFVVKFEPTKGGAYTLKAMYGDKDIPGSPFSIPVIDPAEVAVSGTAVTGKGLGVGKKAEVFVDTTQAGNAPVKATVTTPSGKDIPLSLVPTKTDGVLHGDYVPDEPGKHKLHVNFNEEPIPQSPYDVLVPSQEECSVTEQEDLQSAPSGFHDLPQLVIDTPVGEPGAVEAWVDAPNQKQLQCSVTNQGDKCKVSFFPLTTGMHLVHVTRNKLPVQGSPFPVNVTAQQVLNIEGPEVTQLAVGQPVKLEVSEGVEGKGELEVNVEGPADCRVETKQNPDSTYTIELTPTLAGTYLVHLTHGNRLVRGSPFVVKVFNPLEVKLSGPGVVDSEEDNAQPKPLPLDQQLEWTVDFTSAGVVASDLSATVYGLEGYSQKLAVTDKDAYHASIAFAPNRCGPYKLQVLAGGQEVPHSPVNISLQDVNRVTASGPGLVRGCVGKPVTVTFDTTQAGEGSLSLQIQGPANVTPACTSEEPGTFVVKFEPTKAGAYTLKAMYGDNDIPGSPFSIPIIDPAEVAVSGTAVTGKGLGVGKKAEVFVDTTQAGNAPVKATVTTPSGKDIPLSLVPTETDGVLHGEYVPDEPGKHKLHVNFNEEPISQSPYDVLVPSQEECSVIEQEDLQSAPSGFHDLPQLVIDTPVGELGAVEAWVDAPNQKQLQCSVTNQGDKCKVSFFPLTTGMHLVHVTRNKLPVQGSPFPVNVTAQQVLNIEGPEVTQLAVGQPVKLEVSEGVEGKGELKVNVEGPADCRVETKQNPDSTYTIELTPTLAGTYLVHLTHGNRLVRGSPFVVKVFNPLEVKLSGPGVVDSEEDNAQPKPLPLDQQLEWTVDFTSAGVVASDLSATVYGLEGYSQKLAVTDKDAYHASIAFAPNRCGPYKLQVLAGGQEVPHSPVNISLQDVNRVTASGPGLVRGCVGKPVTVTFDTTQAGEGSLSLQIQGPANVTPACTSEEPGTFVVKFEPTKAGAYTLKAMYGDKDIPGSPFSIPIIDPAEVAVSGTAVTGKGLGVGKKAEVFVDTTQAGNAPVKATVTTPSGKDIPLSLVPTETDGVLHGEYVPDEPGKHKLHVNFNEEPISQSPYDVLVPSQEECSVIEQEDLQSAPSGFHDLPQLVIDTPVGELGAVEAWVDAPNQKQLQCSVTNQGDKCKVSFFPLTTGMHLVHVTRNKLPVQGSPFPVNVTAQQVLNIEGPEVTQLAVGQPVKLEVSEGVEGKGELEINVEGPADCRVETQQNPDSTYTIELTPTLAGTYLVHLTHGNRLVRGSPFVEKVFNPLEVKLSGPGVVDSEEDNAQPKPLPLDQQLEWTVDFTSAGLVASDLSATVYGLEGYSQKLAVTDKDAYHASITFAPNRCGPYKLQVLAGGQEVPHSPVNISLQDVNRVTASGPGLVGGCVGKPVTVTFDTTQAGEGSLSLQIQGPANVTPACTSEEPGTFVVNFEPTKAGAYTLKAMYGDKDIPGSPFSIPVIDPDEVAVSGTAVTGKGLGVGKKAEVFVDTTQAGNAPVKATVTTPSGKDIPLSLVPTKTDGVLHGDYVPDEPGKHKLHVNFNEEPIPQSPYDVLVPSQEECSVTEQEDLQSAPSGFHDLPQLVIDTPVGEPGAVEAWVDAPNQKQLQCSVTNQGDKCKVSFFPLTTGMHLVHVTRNKLPVQGSPFPVNVTAQQVLNIEGPEVTQLAVGQPVKLEVSEGVEGKGELKVNVEGPADCRVETKQNPDSTYTIELTPTLAGTYLVHLTHGNRLVRGSPFVVKVFNPLEVKLSGPGVVDSEEDNAQPKPLPLDQQLEWTVDFTSAGLVASDLSATVYGLEGYSQKLAVTDKDAYHASITFAPNRCGPYKLQVLAGGQEVPHSPVNISLQDVNRVTASGPGLVGGCVGKPVTVTFDTTQAGEGSLSLQIQGPANVTPACTSEEPGTFVVKFEPTKAGAYTLKAMYGDKDIPGSPFSVPIIDPAEVAVSGTAVTGKGLGVGKKAEVFVDTTKAGNAPVKATVTTPSGKDIPLSLVPTETDGVLHGEYVPVEPGKHKLHVNFNEEPIPQSPYDILVPSQEECSVTEQEDLQSAPSGFHDLPQLVIDTPVGEPGAVEAWVDAPNQKQLQCSVTNQGDKCKVSFFPLTTGMHLVHVTRNKLPVQGSPFPVNVTAQQVLNIEGPEVTQLAVGQPVKLEVSEGVEGKGELKVNVEGPADCRVETKQNPDSTYTIELTPTLAGTYLVHLTHGNRLVRGSPFVVKVFNPLEVKLSGPGVVDSEEDNAQPKPLPLDQQLEWTVDFTSAGLVASDLSATVYGLEGYSQKLAVTDKDAYHASITFAPNRCGPYKLQVLAGGQEVPHSPVNISLQDVNRVTASGPGLVGGCVGKPVTVTFDTTQAGEGSLSLQIQGPANVTPACTSEEPGTFVVKFEPTKAGAYTLKAMYGDKDIPGSPFSVPIIDPAEVAVSGTAVTGKGLGVGKKAEVFVDTTKAGNAPVKATVTTPSGKDIPLSLVPTETDGVLHGEYVPVEPGKHKLHVNFNEEPIPQSPYDVLVPSQEECSVTEQEDLQSAPSGFHDLPQLVIDTPVGEPGAVEAWVDAPNQKQLQCSVTNQGNKCKVSFFPLTTGMHLVHVTRNKLPVQGSPFPVNVTAQQVLNIEGPEVTQLAVGQPVKLEVSEGVEGKGELKVNVEGPADCRVETKQNPDSTYTIELTPTLAGTYLVHLTHGNRLVRGSPFVVKVFNPLEVKLSWPGVVDSEEDNAQPKPLPLDQQLEWTVDFTSAGLVASDLSATVYGLEGYSQKLAVTDKDAYHASITFAPNRCGPYKLQVLAGGQEVPHSPVNISLQDVNRVTASGPGLVGGCVGKPVTVTFDTTQAGEGSLSLQIQGPANVTPACTSEEPGTFVVKFEPTKAGAYTLKAMYGDKDIPGSPFSVPIIDPAEVAVSGTAVTGKGLGVGKKAEVFVDTTKAGNAPVKATVTTPSGKDIPLSLVPTETDGVLHGEYVPDEPGKHKLHVNFNEEPIPQSPYDVLVPSQEECSVTEQEDLQSAPSGFHDLPQLVIDTPVGEPGAVEAWVDAPNQKQLQCSVTNQGDKCKVSFFPLTTGMHLVHVTRNKLPVQGSPFPVNVTAQQVLNIEGPEVTQLAVGQPVKLEVSEGVEGKGELEVNVEGPADCRVETKQNPDSTYTIELTPTLAGTYLVHLTHGNRLVRGSPFVVKVFNPLEVKLSGPGVVDSEEDNAQPKPLPLDQQLEWTVDFTSAGVVASDLSATVYGLEGYSQKLAVTDKDAYHASITFAPNRCGPYKLQVLAGGQEVPHSPVNISLQDVNRVTASGPGLVGGCVGKPVTVTFDTTQAGEGSLSLQIQGPANVTPACTSEEPGTFVVKFEPTKAGAYTLKAMYGDKDIPGSPFSIPVIDPDEVAVSGTTVTGKELGVGKKAEVFVDTTQAGNAPVKATVTTPSGKDIPLSLVPTETDGVLHGEYVPDEPGKHKLHVNFNEEPIPQSPYDVLVPSQEECSVTEHEDLQSAPSGFHDLPQLVIDTPVGEPGAVEAWVDAPNQKQLQCSVTNLGDKCKVCFFPLTTGMHLVHVTRNKLPVQGSPFPVNVTAQQVLNIEGPEVTQLAVGQPVKLEVSEGVEGKGELKVNVEGPADCRVETKQNPDSTYTIELTPTLAGTYLVHLTHGNRLVRGSPFVVKVFNPLEVKLSGPGVVDSEEDNAQPKPLPLDQQLEWTVDFTSAGLVASDLSATVYGLEGYSQKLAVTDKDAYHASITFAPNRCGPYKLQVLAGGQEVPHSPVNISLQDVNRVTASGPGLVGGCVGKPVTVTFDTTQAGEGSLSLQIQGPANVTPACTSEEPGTFVVKFEPTKAGAYTLKAMYGDKDIPGSPFSVPIIDPAEVAVSGTAVTGKGLGVGKKAEVFVDTTKAGNAPVKATVTTPSGKDIPLSLVPTETDGVLHGEYVPVEPGKHKLHVNFNEEPIPQSPYDVLVPSQEECSVTEQEDLQSAPSGFHDLPQLVIDTPVGEPGAVEAWVDAPNQKQLQCSVTNQGNKCKVSFFPLTTGMHLVHVTRNKLPVQGSPFPVNVTAQQVLNIEGPEVTQLAVGQSVKLEVSEGVEGKGELKVNVEGPADCRVETKQNPDSTYTIELTPTLAGTYLVHLTHGNRLVRGSPFVVKVFNPLEVKLSGPGVVDSEEDNAQPKPLPLDQQLEWTVDFTSAGLVASDLSATVYGLEGYSQKLAVTDIDAYHASITFAPNRCGPYKLQVLAGGQEVPHSPVNISLQDVNRVTASGPGLVGGCVGKPVTVTFDTTQAGEGSLSLQIQGPANVTPACTSEEPGTFVVNFEPTKAGAYTLKAMYGDKDIPGSPFSIPVIDPAEVAVSGTAVTGKGLGVGKKAEVFVDTTQAGNAPVKATVTTPSGKDIPSSLVPTETDGVLHGEYVPDEPVKHKLHVNFNEEPIPQSPYDILVPSQEECSVTEQEDLQSAPSGFHDFPQLVIDTPVGEPGAVEAWVDAPNQKQLQCSVTNQGDKCKVCFFPLTTGMHLVHVTRNKLPVQGSPFPVNVTAQQVLNIEGPEVTQLAVGQPVKLEVSEGVEGKGELKVNVEGPADCRVETKQNPDSTYTIELTPTLAGTYLVHLTHGNRLVRGSPFVVKVFNPLEVKLSGPGVVDSEEDNAQPKPLPLDQQLEWTVDFTSAGLVASDLSATVYGLEGYSQKLAVTDKDAYHASITFASNRCGPYKLQVLAGGQEVPHSPVNISLQDVSRVTASGPGLVGGCVGKPVTVTFDTTQAGEGSLSLQIQGPANVTPACTSEEPGTFVVNFEPTKAGAYTLKAMYGDKDIPGSPFSIPVIDPTVVAVSGTAVTGKGLGVGKKAEVFVDTTQAGNAPVKATVTTPSGMDIPLSLVPTETDGVLHGDYVPDEPGKHKLCVTLKEEPISLSPLDILIPCEEQCIMMEQDGIEAASSYCIDLHEQPPLSFSESFDLPELFIDGSLVEVGTVEAWVEAPNETRLLCTVSKHGEKFRVFFIPLLTGMHYVHVVQNQKPIQGSPFPINVTSQHIFSIRNYQTIQLIANETVHLQVLESVQRAEDLKVLVDGPSDCNVEIKQNANSTYTIELTPKAEGIYLIHIMYCGHLVNGSTLALMVTSLSEQATLVNNSGKNSGIVHNDDNTHDGSKRYCQFAFAVSGPGIEGGELIGQVAFAVKALGECEENVNVEICGPQSCDMMMRNDGDGTTHVQYVPTVPGMYDINITCAGNHIKGSPYRVHWSRPLPDASKCTVSGIENNGRFHIDCRSGGGFGYLEVAVFGAFVPAEDIAIKHNGDFTFDITYKISQPGKTTISVKWHGVHLRGSPFTVYTE